MKFLDQSRMLGFGGGCPQPFLYPLEELHANVHALEDDLLSVLNHGTAPHALEVDMTEDNPEIRNGGRYLPE